MKRHESPIDKVNLGPSGASRAAREAASQVTALANFNTDKVLGKPGSKDRKLSVPELVKERIKFQAELLKSYPDMPTMSDEIRTFTDYAYAAHDQAQFLM